MTMCKLMMKIKYRLCQQIVVCIFVNSTDFFKKGPFEKQMVYIWVANLCCLWFTYKQWHSHWGGKGGRVPPLTVGKNQEKLGKKEEKSEKREIIGKRQKSGRFFHFAPPDR